MEVFSVKLMKCSFSDMTQQIFDFIKTCKIIYGIDHYLGGLVLADLGHPK
jgi:hypothetical protein